MGLFARLFKRKKRRRERGWCNLEWASSERMPVFGVLDTQYTHICIKTRGHRRTANYERIHQCDCGATYITDAVVASVIEHQLKVIE